MLAPLTLKVLVEPWCFKGALKVVEPLKVLVEPLKVLPSTFKGAR